ncbi:MAG TPA: CHAD domain-containing protein [Pyrinomonadaceae bacterium]
MAKAKEISGLDYGAAAGDGIRLILRSRFAEMRAYRDQALDWSDIKGVHDMRVASRRLRSALKDFMPRLPRRKLRRFSKDLKDVADALGAVRDQDVAITALEELAAKAPAEVSAGIERLVEERRRTRELARAELKRVIADDALGKLEEDFTSALEHGLKGARKRQAEDDERKAIERVSCRQAGREVIAARLRELLDLSQSLYWPLKTKPLHEMRIVAKRLRYAIELFAPCWGEPLASFAKEIAKLQTSLGELHDCDLWILEIGALLRATEHDKGRAAIPRDEEMMGDAPSTGNPVSAPAQEAQRRNAAIWLLDYFVIERTHRFRDALARWHEWELTGFHARLAALINNETLAGEFTRAALTPAEAVAADLQAQENS